MVSHLPTSVSNLFLELCDLETAERAGRLAQQPDEVRAAVEALLRHHDRPNPLLEKVESSEFDPQSGEPDHPDQIGPYRILGVLGHGGMGEVYLAEQQEPVQRRVALKQIKRGLDSASASARFELERQALAVMEHPAIARIYDCGTSETGELFFVMELVEGEPVPDYCDRHRLTIAERIQLFQQVCAGVQHAHNKGVVHRDLKPSNVMVVTKDERPLVKIIDFGVARVIDHDLIDHTQQTVPGALIGTPEYMAPEQASGQREVIDTRTDVYSLGVLLYELLCGELPFSSAELRQRGILEVARFLSEIDPPKPSTRATQSDPEARERASKRNVTTERLQRELSGDLDWIVLRAMAKEPDRRYGSAQQLAEDLGRFLQHQPVAAGPPTARYRIAKFVRRHRIQVMTGLALLLVLVTGVGFATHSFARARDLAQRNGSVAATKLTLAEDLTSVAEEFDLLAGDFRYEKLLVAEPGLHPAWPHQQAALASWLDDCDQLLLMRPEIESAIEHARRKALPLTEVERLRDLETHARYREWVHEGKLLESARRADAVRQGRLRPSPVDVPGPQQILNWSQLEKMASARVGTKTDRLVHEEEALGLAYARLAVQKAEGTANACFTLDTLALALLVNGLDAEALQCERRIGELASPDEKAAARESLASAEHWVHHAAEQLAQRELDYERFTAEVAERRTWTFRQEDGAVSFLHDSLTELLVKIDRLEAGQRRDVERRVRWAGDVAHLTESHPNALVSWEDVEEILASSELYGDAVIEWPADGRLGLVPLGENPVTGLLEFYHLRSAWDEQSDPAGIEIPVHRSDGSIEVGDSTGIVFALLPGGQSAYGAQNRDPDGLNYDPQSDSPLDPSVFEVTLLPFLLARHELTQGQWARLWTGDPSLEQPNHYKPGVVVTSGHAITWANPVTSLTRELGETVLSQYGLRLPFDHEWEYGCRAGSSSPWFCSPDELARSGNFADQAFARVQRGQRFEDWNDGYVWHAPVGTFEPNAFGLYDVHGNVFEWTTFGVEADRDSARGGSFFYTSYRGRSAQVTAMPRSVPSFNTGVRPARSLRPLED